MRAWEEQRLVHPQVRGAAFGMFLQASGGLGLVLVTLWVICQDLYTIIACHNGFSHHLNLHLELLSFHPSKKRTLSILWTFSTLHFQGTKTKKCLNWIWRHCLHCLLNITLSSDGVSCLDPCLVKSALKPLQIRFLEVIDGSYSFDGMPLPPQRYLLGKQAVIKHTHFLLLEASLLSTINTCFSLSSGHWLPTGLKHRFFSSSSTSFLHEMKDRSELSRSVNTSRQEQQLTGISC